jgi:hypothetical protein
MAGITFNTAHRAAQIRDRLETALAAVRKMLDAFVGYRMRLVASDVGHARTRRRQDTPSHSKNLQ